MTPAANKAKARHEEVSKVFGKMVRDRRVQLGMSVNEASRLSGMAWSNWDRLEGGKSSLLSMYKAAEVLGWELFLEVEEK